MIFHPVLQCHCHGDRWRWVEGDMSHGGRQVEQIEELWPCLIGRTCCVTSEDRHAGKETDIREKLELKVIHACAHMIIADDA